MHPDDTLFRLADLVIAAENLTGDDQDRIRAQALKLAVAVARKRLESNVVAVSFRPNNTQPEGAA